MQWLPTRFYGSLSVYSRPPPLRKNSPLAAQLKIAFRRFLLQNVWIEVGIMTESSRQFLKYLDSKNGKHLMI